MGEGGVPAASEASTLLYHGTTIDALVSILASGTLEAGYDETLGEGVSFSESLEIAQGFARHNEVAFDDTLRTWYGIGDVPLPDRTGVVLVIDRSMLPSLNAVDDLGQNFEREWRTAGPVADIVSALHRIDVSHGEKSWYATVVDRFEKMDGAEAISARKRGLLALGQIIDNGIDTWRPSAAMAVMPKP